MLPTRVLEERLVRVPSGGAELDGELTLPAGASALAVLAHGSGSSRFSPRSRALARNLQERRLATLLFDLLTEDEEWLELRGGRLRFDLGLLSRRMIDATDWMAEAPQTRELRFGCFGESTGAAAALVAAAERPGAIHAVVSRGGRPDLAALSLPRVKAPTLFLVGANDPAFIELNREAMNAMRCETRMHMVPGATHAFTEPGALEDVARQAGDWFDNFLAGGRNG